MDVSDSPQQHSRVDNRPSVESASAADEEPPGQHSSAEDDSSLSISATESQPSAPTLSPLTRSTSINGFSITGVKFSYIRSFIAECGGDDVLRGMTTTQVSKTFVMPLTAASKMSLCEQLQLLLPSLVLQTGSSRMHGCMSFCPLSSQSSCSFARSTGRRERRRW